MKTFFRYIYFSNFKISFDFSPFVWSFKWFHEPPSYHDPTLNIFYLRILPFSFILVLDDGCIQRTPPFEEQISVKEDW